LGTLKIRFFPVKPLEEAGRPEKRRRKVKGDRRRDTTIGGDMAVPSKEGYGFNPILLISEIEPG
jgi:hypothetical protein